MSDKPLRVAVIGGGITGLSAAFRLQSRLTMLGRPFEILLMESSARLGGLINTQHHDGFLLESGPDCFLSGKTNNEGLVHELSIASEAIGVRPENKRALIAKGSKLYPIPREFRLLVPGDMLEMLGTSLLSLKDKVQMLREFVTPAAKVPDESIGAFVRRHFGPGMWERIVQPMIGGIYGGDADQISLRATFPQFLELEKKGSILKQALLGSSAMNEVSGLRYQSFISFKGGMQTLIDRLGHGMSQVGAMLNTSVVRLEALKRGWRVHLKNGQTVETDAVCLCLPAYLAAPIIESVQPAMAKTLGSIPYSDSLAVYYAFRETDLPKLPAASGFLVPAADKRNLSACTFVHRKFSNRAPQGLALLRGYATGKAVANLWHLQDTDVDKRMLQDLKALLTIKGHPLFTVVHRYSKGLPQYTVGHLEKMDVIRQTLATMPLLALAGNWKTGVGIPDGIEAGERAADHVVMDLCQL